MGSTTKRLAHFSLLLIFLTSLALFAMAEEGSRSRDGLAIGTDVKVTGSVEGSAADDNDDDTNDDDKDDRVRVDAIAKADSKISVRSDKDGTRMDEFRKRMKMQEEKFREIKNRLSVRMDEIKVRFDNAKAHWLDIRGKIRGHQDVNRSRAFEAAKDFALQSNENVQNYLERLKTRAAIQLEEDNATAIGTKIDAQIAVLADLSTKIEATTDANGLKALLPEIRKAQSDAKELAKKVVGLLLVELAQKRVDHVQGIHDRIQNRANELKADGIDTNTVEVHLTAAAFDLNAAIEAIGNAQAVFGADVNADVNADQSFKTGREYLHEANRYINDALRDLRAAVSALIALTPRHVVTPDVNADVNVDVNVEALTEVTA